MNGTELTLIDELWAYLKTCLQWILKSRTYIGRWYKESVHLSSQSSGNMNMVTDLYFLIINAFYFAH